MLKNMLIDSSNNSWDIILESIGDGLIVHDLDGNILFFNTAAGEISGWSEKEAMGKNIFELFVLMDAGTNKIIESPIHNVLKLGSKIGLQENSMLVTKKNDYKYISASISPIKDTLGVLQGAVIVFRDITRIRKMGIELKEAKIAAEMSNKAKSQFVANMSHEIRTPLNGILGMVDLTLIGQLDYEQKENLNIVKSCVNQLVDVINDILDFSKMEAGKMRIENIDFDIKKLIQETLKIHSPHAINKEVRLNYSFSSNVPQYLIGDSGRLLQILNNLISNAIKFTDSGEVWINVKRINTTSELIELQFSIEDTGIGIAEENIVKIFKSFIQVDGSFTKRFGGTGLGLTISKQLTEMMGGTIWLESKLGIGSTFYFTLKFKAGNKIKVLPKQILQFDKITRPCNVLLVEDETVNQLVINRLLKNRGYYVDTASNGLEALEMFQSEAYDLILMDIQMPVMDGIEAAKKIREKEENAYISIIGLSAYALEGDREKFLLQGFDGYVSKPIKVEELFAAMDQCLDYNKIKQNIRDISICFDEKGEVLFKQKEISVLDHKNTGLLDELSYLVETLNSVLIRNKVTCIETLAHKIKNLSNEIGIDELKAISFKVELAARKGNFPEAIENAQKVSPIFETFKNRNDE